MVRAPAAPAGLNVDGCCATNALGLSAFTLPTSERDSTLAPVTAFTESAPSTPSPSPSDAAAPPTTRSGNARSPRMMRMLSGMPCDDPPGENTVGERLSAS